MKPNINAPILDFFEEEGLINKESYMKNSKDFDKVERLLHLKIDSALFIFYKEDITEFLPKEKLEEVYTFLNGSNKNKCYIYDNKFVLALSPLGGSAASGIMEELGFMGIKNFFACGSAGQINNNIDSSEFILVNKAIRCEGTSYKYLEPSLYVETDDELRDVIKDYLIKNKYKFNESITWTTDSFYRETQSEIELRKGQGAVSVEMECASWAAVAKFRKYKFAQLLYFSDAVQQEGWKWHPTKKELKHAVINLMIDCVSNFVKTN